MKRYPQPVHDFIAAHVTECSVRELAERVNQEFGTSFTESKMKCYMKNHSLRNGRPNGVLHGYSRLFPQEVQAYIFASMKGVGPREMTGKVNERFGAAYTVEQMKSFYGRKKLHSGVTGYFAPRHIPWNKGMARYSAPGTEHTRFQPGELPPTTLPVGSESNTKDGYIQVKIAMPNVWKLKHRLIWEQAHGPIPDGHSVMFKDKNKRNFDPDNLMLVSRSQLAIMNHENLWGETPEANESYALVAKLKNQISRRSKK